MNVSRSGGPPRALVAALCGVLVLSACQSSSPTPGTVVSDRRLGPNAHRSDVPLARPAEPVPPPKAVAAATPPAAHPGRSVAELAFPTGDRATSSILLRQTSPSEIRAGSEYEYTIDVINLNSADLQNVIVNLENARNVKFLGSNPEAVKTPDGDTAWLLGDLRGGATKSIVLRARAEDAGVASNCLSVVYANVLCIATEVVEPTLALAKTATPEICGTCESISLTYSVGNSGTGVAEGVVLKDLLPEGLATIDGKREVEIKVGDLDGGAERTFHVVAKAAKAGRYASAASVTGQGGLRAASGEAATVVKEPALAVTCDAGDRVFVGRDVTYRFTVRNPGTCAATDAAVRAPVPSGTQFVSADGGGKLEAGSVVWRMPSVAAGQSTLVSMTVRPTGTGSAAVTATATAECLDPVVARCATEVAGIPAILLEVVDALDPVEIGKETTFTIVATNQGSAVDHDVKVVGSLPPSMTFVSGTGSSAVSASGQVVTMSPVASLAPGAKAEWRITVRAASAEDARSRWEMTSAQFKTPVTETESTYLFR